MRVSPRAGSALVFWHGQHPSSALHEGAPLEASPPEAASTAVLFSKPPQPEVDALGWAESSATSQAMLRGIRLAAVPAANR